MNAVFLINKPVGYRSSECVGIARKQLKGLKTGHTGTLDSTASGLLVLMLGYATRFSEFVMLLPKIYRTVIQFGAETDTYDYSGEITSEHGYESLDVKTLNDSLYSFSGWRLQRPPAVSAIKIDGKPAYKLARSGKEPEMKARPVLFREIKILKPYASETGTLELEVHCGRGTYIRSLAHDLGKITGCGAYVKSLERLAVGNFTLSNANNLDDEEYRFTTLHELAKNFTRIYVSQRDERSFMNGLSILLRQAESFSRGVSIANNAIFVEGDKFLGVGEYVGYDYIKPVVIVPKV